MIKMSVQTAGRLGRRTVLAGATAIAVALSLPLLSSPVQALAGDLAAITKASDLDKDPQDFQAVTAVCTACHAASQFLSTPRSSSRWEQVFAEMTGYGAGGTDDQLDRVVNY